MSIDIIDALDALNANYEYVSRGNTYADIEWLDSRPQPTEEELNAKIAELQSERPLKDLRRERNARLFETDWMACQDRDMSQAERDYRQALRDITKTYTSLDDVVWPEKPTE